MASRTWLAVALCCFVWFGYIKWFAPQQTPAQEQTLNATQSATTTTSSTAPAPAGGEAFTGQALKPVETQQLKNDRVELGFSATGGKIARATVEGYREDIIKKDSPRISVFGPEHATQALGTFFSEAVLAPLATNVYQAKVEGQTAIFDSSAAGVSVHKEYKLNDASYFVDSKMTLQFPKSDRTNWGYLMIPLGGSSLPYDEKEPLHSWEVVGYQNESITRKTFAKIEGETVQQGNTAWLGFGNRYFATTVINQSELNPDVVFLKRGDFTGAYLRYPLQLKPGQNQLSLGFRIFAGPKDYTDLSTVPGMKQLINYGTFSVFAYPLLWLLRFFYNFIHNYGVAIILVTLLVRILFYPLSLKSFKSMRAMQKIQPQIAALKEKHKDDMQRFNQEQMALFKAHNVNPMGGCLPMLVQMPVFFALYAVLGNSIELFHAPFYGWVHDLSSKDPLYIFPVLMGISMFVQQKMTPTASMDPAQAKMMLIMPVVFTFIMINLPSGLTIYIFLSTLMGILQQMSMNKDKNPTPQLATVSPPSRG